MTIATEPIHHPHHEVQFYEDDLFLVERVASFLAEGAMQGEACCVIATAEHNAAFAMALGGKGVDPGAVRFLDARATLDRFLDRGMPDAERFQETVGGAFHEISGGTRVRAYGEMVDVLWKDGAPDAAIRLEELWNDLASHYAFTLLCAYPMANFHRESDGGLFDRICDSHSIVRPTERSIGDGIEDRERRIATLERRAAALELEIAHRKQLERKLADSLAAHRRSEDLLRDFVENATVGLHWVLADGTIEWANDAELKMLGYPRSAYVGRNIAEFHADQRVIEDILIRLSRGEELHDYEAALIAADGSTRWVSISSSVLFEGGEFVHTRCFSRDITVRKRLENQNALLLDATALIASSLDYRTRLTDLTRVIVPRLADWCAVDIARDRDFDRVAIAHADSETEALAVQVNERWPAHAGHDPVREVLKSGRASILPRVGSDEMSTLARSEKHRVELRRLGLHSLMIVPMVACGRVVGAVTMAAAETRPAFTPDDLPLAMDLASRAAGMIEIARLYHLAESSNRAKDQFLATLSHELRTPLTSILGWARLMSFGRLDEETLRTAVSTIEHCARTQASLVDDLLDVSRIVSGKLSLEKEPVDLVRTISEAVDAMRVAADARRICVEVFSSEERLVVQGDATRLQQIAWNLVSNAIKFSEEGGGVRVSLEHDARKARLIVRDEGRGIAPQFLPHVFEPFRQADSSSTRTHGGLGLGLAIVRYLVEAHGGTVTAESDGLGKGAVFTVTLPLARRALGNGIKPQALADLTGVRMLIVDDDPDLRRMLEIAFARCGAEVETAKSVEGARVAIGERPPDIIITDVAMPNEDGTALLSHVRADDRTRDIPVFALTAFRDGDDVQKGFDGFLRKPMDPLEIARRVARYVRQGKEEGVH